MEVRFPRIVSPFAAQVIVTQQQLARFERLDPAEQERVTTRQFAALWQHATAFSPFWRERLSAASPRTPLAELPILTRADIQAHGAQLRARTPEMAQKNIKTVRSSGSTGHPVQIEVYKPVYWTLYRAQALRDAVWHNRDGNRDMLTIKDRPDTQPGRSVPQNSALEGSGKTYNRNQINHSPEDLCQWLSGFEAPYLVTTPAMALRLARLALADRTRSKRLDLILTYGEVVTEELREAARAAFGARVIDRYSCEEVGWVAFQCPKHDHFHALSSTVRVEIVDEQNRPVSPGEEGRVLVTSLHSYAMPLIRYDLGDRAIAGAPCDCGINLPVIHRILGRERSFIRLADGSLRLARLTGEYWLEIAPIREYRVVQYADGIVEAFVTCERRLESREIEALRTMLGRVLHPSLERIVTQVDRIDWGSRWKRIDVMRLDRPRHAAEPGDAAPQDLIAAR
jgi:phenylacetate-CoA ligase